MAVDLDEDFEETRELSKKELEERERQRKKNQKKKGKKKKSKQRKREEEEKNEGGTHMEEGNEGGDEAEDDDVEIEYVPQEPELESVDPNYYYFSKVFEAFKIGEKKAEEEKVVEGEKKVEVEKEGAEGAKGDASTDTDKSTTKAIILQRLLQEEEEDRQERENEEKQKDKEENKLSKKKLRLMLRPSIAELKATCNRPDVVEWHDVTSKDPKLLVHLKSLRNTVPVPRHWCFKRKYLAGKRGFERPPFELPDFIKKTGIQEMRQALQEKEEEKTMKTKMREKVRPKMGRIDIDYQKLHDAFFRWQTKPKMSILGDLYFEGKEFETRLREKKPGELSDDIRIALGMPVGPNALKFPPPWLIAMQRYGPPPSYPNLKIAGLNAPIPEECAFGYHAGGWGKPPVDEIGKPLYGDVFGVEVVAQPTSGEEESVEKKLWGEMESEESEEESEEEEEEEGEGDKEAPDADGLLTPAEGMITPSGISSGLPTGVETPDSIELRKKKMIEEGGETPSSLYTILPEKRVDRVAGQMMASTHVYDIAAAGKKDKGAAESGVDVTLNPEELDLQDPQGLQRKYEEGLRQQKLSKEDDFSDMVAEHTAKQNRKRKLQEEKKTQKNYKEKFKF